MYSYAHATLDDDTSELTGLWSGDRHFAINKDISCLKCLPNCFTQQMSLFSMT